MRRIHLSNSSEHVVILGSEKARVRRTGEIPDCEIATVIGITDGKICRLVALADMRPIVEAYRRG